MDRRELLLGDWNPVVRDPLDVLRGAFVAASAGDAATGGGKLINLAFSSAAVVGVRFLSLPRPYDLGFVAAMTLTGWGDALGLYDRFPQYDNAVHFLVWTLLVLWSVFGWGTQRRLPADAPRRAGQLGSRRCPRQGRRRSGSAGWRCQTACSCMDQRRGPAPCVPTTAG